MTQDKAPNASVDVNFTFVSADEAAKEKGTTPAAVQASMFKVLARVLGDAAARELLACEDGVLAWIRSDPKNAAAWVSDPIAALARLGLPIAPATIEALQRWRAASMANTPQVPHVPFGKVTAR